MKYMYFQNVWMLLIKALRLCKVGIGILPVYFFSCINVKHLFLSMYKDQLALAESKQIVTL